MHFIHTFVLRASCLFIVVDLVVVSTDTFIVGVVVVVDSVTVVVVLVVDNSNIAVVVVVKSPSLSSSSSNSCLGLLVLWSALALKLVSRVRFFGKILVIEFFNNNRI